MPPTSYLVHLILMVCEMRGKRTYNCFLWGVAFKICSKQHIVFLYSSHLAFSLLCFVSIQVVHPYSSIDMATVWKKSHFILSERSDFHMLIAVHTFAMCLLTPFSVAEILLSRYVNCSTNLKLVKMFKDCLKQLCILFLAPSYATEIHLGQVYLQEALDCQHSLHLS